MEGLTPQSAIRFLVLYQLKAFSPYRYQSVTLSLVPRLVRAIQVGGGGLEPSATSYPKSLIGLSQLCSATFEQLLAFGATFCGSSNLKQILPSEQLLRKI